jgi:hypothetical protein
MTAEDDPAIHEAAVVAPTMSTGSGVDMSAQPAQVDMSVQPTEVEGRAATFGLTYRNHSPAPISVALAAQDGEERLRFRCEPAEPVIVPAGSASAVMVHVVPKVRETVGVPHEYAIVFRALQVWPVRESNPDLVREARFTYVPLIPTPATTMLPAWLRRLPLWTLPLPLVLLGLLLVLAAARTRASTTTQPTWPRSTHLHVVVDNVGRATQQLRVAGGALAATARPASAVPTLWLNPNAVHFAKDGANTTSSVQTIHVTNVSGRHITITRIGISGTNPSNFTEDDTCAGATLALFGGCTIRVRFTPVMPGPHRATLRITDDTTGSAQTVPLSGDG